MKSPKTSKAPKRIGKHQRYSKNTKRFAAGGGTDDGELSLDNLSFGQAFNAVRQHMKDQGMDPNKQVFTWRGKKYSTAMAAPKPVAAEPVNARAEEVFRALKSKSDAAAPKFSASRPYATAAQAASEAARRGIEDKPIEQVAPETWGLGGALKGAAALGTAALGGRALLKAALANEARSAARMSGEAEKMEMLRKSRILNAQKAKRAEQAAADKAAEARRRLEENEDYTQYAMKRGGKVSRKRGCK